MSDLYVISNGDFQLLDDAEQIEDGSDLREFDFSLPMHLAEPQWNRDSKKRIERRRHNRFHLIKDAFALIRPASAKPLNILGKSMGCIACSVFKAKPVRHGKIDNIGMGGLMFQHIASKMQLDRTCMLDILLTDCGFYLAAMPFEIKTDVVLSGDISDDPFEMRQVRLQFKNLNVTQQARLNEFLYSYGTESGESGLRN